MLLGCNLVLEAAYLAARTYSRSLPCLPGLGLGVWLGLGSCLWFTATRLHEHTCA